MSLLDLFFSRKKNTASMAKERLQIILAHESTRLKEEQPAWLADLQKELLQVVAKYVQVNQEDLTVNLETRDNVELLEINVSIPEKKENHNA